jgi:hypothetical protein
MKLIDKIQLNLHRINVISVFVSFLIYNPLYQVLGASLNLKTFQVKSSFSRLHKAFEMKLAGNM